MWTIILTFLKNPKNLIIMILAALFILCMGMILYQRTSIATKSAKVESQQVEIARLKQVQKAYQDLAQEYTDQVIKWKQLAEKNQAITNQTAKVVTKIKYIKSDCKVEGNDAKIVNSAFEYFNAGRLRD